MADKRELEVGDYVVVRYGSRVHYVHHIDGRFASVVRNGKFDIVPLEDLTLLDAEDRRDIEIAQARLAEVKDGRVLRGNELEDALAEVERRLTGEAPVIE